MRITFHGVRGSTPHHGDHTRRYGGNTSCVSLQAPGEEPVLFDLGTGLRHFAEEVTDGPFTGTALLTHFHWDHVQGLPFFSPMHVPGARLDVYAPLQDDGRTVAEVFADIVRPPVFPVTLDDLAGSFVFHDVGCDEFAVGGLRVLARPIPHTGPTVGFRVTWGDVRVAYVSDHQQTLDGPFRLDDAARELLDGVDLLVHDAQYAPADFEGKRDWGHCTPEFALWVAGEVGAKQLALYHHDPRRHDDDIDATVSCLARVGEQRGVHVFAASQGMVVELGD